MTTHPRKHLVLLVAIVVVMVIQPLAGHTSVRAGMVFDAVFAMICISVFFTVFDKRRESRVAPSLFLAGVAGNVGMHALPARLQTASTTAYHCFIIMFLSFAVAMILRDLFRKSVIRGDDVLGAFCGYLLFPGAFSANLEIAWRLGEWHQRRALFDYLSFTTLLTLGYDDLTPIGPSAYSLTWLEAMVGQFYMAVVVAQLVGLKLAQALRGDRPESK